MPGWREQRQCVETLFWVRNVDQADFERRIWIVSSEAVGDHCSDIVSGDVDLLVPERLGQLVNILGHILLVVAQPRSGRTSHSAKMLWGLAAARLDILQVDQNLVRSIR